MNSTPVYLVKRIRKLVSGKSVAYWQLRWASSEGKIRSETIGRCDRIRKRDALSLQRVKEAAIGSGAVRRDKPSTLTVGDFLTIDRDMIASDVTGSTLVEHDNAAKHARDSIGSDTQLGRITLADVGKLKKHLASSGRSPATIGKTLRMLRAAFNRAKFQGLIDTNPFSAIGIPRSDGKAKRIFTRTESNLLVTVSPNLWWQTFLKLAFTSGMRRDEMLNLLWDDVDFVAGTVCVQAKASRRITVAGRDFGLWQWMPKAKASNRTIPIPQGTIESLNRQRSQQGASPFVFIDMRRLGQLQTHLRDGKLPAKFHLANNLLRRFHAIQDAARLRLSLQPVTLMGQPLVVSGVPMMFVDLESMPPWRRGCLHDIRRTYCTEMAAHVPMHVLREWAGHSNISTTATYYLGMADGMAERARAAFDIQ